MIGSALPLAAILMLMVTLPMIGWGLSKVLSGGSSSSPPDSPPPAHGRDRRTGS